MSGIASSFSVAPVSTTIAATTISTTTLATAKTIAYVSTPHVQIGFENTGDVDVFVTRTPINIDNNGVTVAGTQVYFKAVPATSYRVLDVKANAVHFGPAIYKVYAASTPGSGILEIVTLANK